jgi:hypothetical protein
MADPVKITLDTSGIDDLLKSLKDAIPTFIIEDGVEYGIYQEFTASGHPSLVPAFERNTKALPQAVGEAIEKGINVGDVVKATAFNIQREWQADVNVDTGAFKNSIHTREE